MPASVIGALAEIMLGDEHMARRLDAAEQILAFESPQDAVQVTKAFLTEVFQDPGTTTRDKLRALELIRKSEDKKTAPPQTANEWVGFAERLRAARLAYYETLKH